MAFGLGAVDEIVERLVRAFLAGEDEVVAAIFEHLDDAVAGEKIVGEIDWTQRLQARAVRRMPAFDGGARAILLLGAVLLGDELGPERDDLGMSLRDDGGRQHGMIALDLAVGALARLAARARDPLAAEILGPVEGDEGSAAEPAEALPHGGFEQQLLHALKAGREQSGIGAVEHVADVIVGRDFLDAEQGLAVRAALALLQRPLEGEERRALHEEHGEGRKPEIGHADITAATLARVREGGADGLQAQEKRRQKHHPQAESFFR